jgi:putative tRNA adenosine deaminase-associated protein
MPGDSEDSLAVVVFREEGAWQSGALPSRVTDDLQALIDMLRQQPGDDGAIALVNVADEFFVAVRVMAGAVRILLSDVTAAVAWDLARQVVSHLSIIAPSDDELEEIWPAGDLSIFSDLGIDEMELGALLSDVDAYADEMLVALSRRLGFADVYDRAVQAAVG